MATTAYGVNDALARKAWSKMLAHESLYRTWADKFTGGQDAIIEVKRELEKDAGDKITHGLRMQLEGAGVAGDGTLEGNEESLVTYSDSLVIDQLRHAVRSAGKMTEQRIPFSIRKEALDGLADWWAARFDESFFNQVCGNAAQTDTRYTGMNPVTAPSAGRKLFTEASATADSDIDSTGDEFDLDIIDAAVETARMADPIIRPVKVSGEDYYVVVIHEYCRTDLRTAAVGDGSWFDIQKAAITGGQTTNNPIFNGSLGVYNNCVIHASRRVTTGENSGVADTDVRRNVLLGAQAACLAFGQGSGEGRYDWYEELFDYGNQLGVKAGQIWGLKKSLYNSVDFGVLTLSSYAAAHTGS